MKHVQDATYSCKITCNQSTGLPSTWSFTGVDWTSDGGADFVIDSPKAVTTAAHARKPGEFKATGTARLLTDDGQTVLLPGVDSCAAFGGPITFKPIPGSVVTWEHDLDDETKPWYLQNFYSHADTVTGTMQIQQKGSVEIHGQPAGTTMTWSFPTFLHTDDPTTVTGTESLVKVTADAVGTGAVTCGFAIRWLDPTASTPGNPVYRDATGADDTATTQAKNKLGVWANLVNEFHAHRPATLTWTGVTTPSSGSLAAGYAYAKTEYTMTLKDDGQQGMPDVWVQERFDSPLPPSWFTINTDTVYWISMKSPLGQLGGVDKIEMTWNPPQYPWMDYHFTHHYWAASTNAAPTSIEGIEVGNATMNFLAPTSTTPASAGQKP